jgi:hypothetical protein
MILGMMLWRKVCLLFVAAIFIAATVAHPAEDDWLESGSNNWEDSQHHPPMGVHPRDNKANPGPRKKSAQIHHKHVKKNARPASHHKTAKHQTETHLVSTDRLRPASKVKNAKNRVQKRSSAEAFAHWVSEKLNMHAASREKNDDDDDDECDSAPKMTTALILQIFLGYFGIGFAYMGRWDWFAISLGVFIAPILLACFALCIRNKDDSKENSSKAPLMVGAIGAVCTATIVIIIMLWSIIAIANKSLDCGNGCQLQD